VKIIKENNLFKIEDFSKVQKYPYKHYNRFADEKGRKYLVEEKKVPSVTTILSATQSDEKRQGLLRWRKKEGEAQAQKILSEATKRGTEMHYVLENYLNGQIYYNESPEGERPRIMAHTILENLTDLTEVWGNEVSLAYEDKYAGTTDCIALYGGKPTIVDFKQSNKLKKEEWVEDYKYQLGAYYLAHVKNYGPIEQGIISICCKDLTYQSFLLNEDKLKEYSDKFLQRVEQFQKLQ